MQQGNNLMEERKDIRRKREGEVDLVELLSKLWVERKFILRCCLVGLVVGIIVGFSLPKTYKATMSFAPETEQQVGSGVSSIASMMGVSLNNRVDAIRVDMFPDVVASTPFIYDLFDLQIETKDSLSMTLLDYMKDHQKKPWWSHVIGAPFKALSWFMKKESSGQKEYDVYNLPLSQRNIIAHLSKNIVVNLNKKTGKTTISVSMQDPYVAATVLNAVVDNLKQYMSDYRTSKDRQDVENLTMICEQRRQEYYAAQKAYADFADANKNLVKLNAQAEQLKLQQEMNLAYQVYSQVATNLEGTRIQAEQAKPVFVVINPVMVPLKKSSPSKVKILAVLILLAGACAASWVLMGEEYWNKFKDLQ